MLAAALTRRTLKAVMMLVLYLVFGDWRRGYTLLLYQLSHVLVY